MVSWAHAFAAEVLTPGGAAVDLTVGRGQDTLFLFQRLGPEGTIIGFDVQKEALADTAALLEDAGARVKNFSARKKPLPPTPQVSLICASHAEVGRYVAIAPQVVLANLGYLPGGDRGIATRVESSRLALQTSLALLAPGGRLIVVVYVGHEEGARESQMIEAWAAQLCSRSFYVLRLENFNRHQSPYLIVIERRTRSAGGQSAPTVC